MCRKLRELIKHTVSPPSWEDRGGPGVVSVVPGGMAVVQVPTVQLEIERLLAQLQPVLTNAQAAIRPEERSPARQRLEQALASPISLDVQDKPFYDVLQQVAGDSGMNVVLSHPDAALFQPVSCQAQDTPVAKLFDQLLAPLGLDWIVWHDVVVVTMCRKARSQRETRLYDLRPLVKPAGRWTEKELSGTLFAALAPSAAAQADDDAISLLHGILIAHANQHTHQDLENLLRDNGAGLERLRLLLASLSAHDLLPAIRRGLEDPSPLIRCCAVRAVAKSKSETAAEWAAAVLNDPDYRVRIAAAEAIGASGHTGKRFVDALAARLADSDVDLQRAVIRALASFGPEAAPAALKLAPLADAADLRDDVFKALVAVGPAAAVPALIRMLDDHDDLAGPACLALKAIGPEAHAAVPALLRRLRTPDARWSAAAAQALGSIKAEPEVVAPALTEALHELNDSFSYYTDEAEYYVCDALGRFALDSPDAMRALEALLNDEKPHIREVAVQTLGNLGEVSIGSLPALLALAGDRNLSQAAMKAVVAIGPKSVPHLIKALQERRDLAPVCRALGEIGEPSAAPYLLEVLDDASFEVRAAACKALGEIGASADTVVPALAAALRSTGNQGDAPDTVSLRVAACQALGQFGPQTAAAKESLEAALDDPDASVREAARAALDAF